ncbi:MAG: radical SAM protein, partial [FCB group bacterium]|nr:radical SAM protein [FCB group bacterium]
MLLKMKDGILYGPVNSRRLGKSLGINLSPGKQKLCSFNCVYCHYGWTKRLTTNLTPYANELPSADDVISAIEGALKSDTEFAYITFSGNGEPTLHPEFPQLVDQILRLKNKYRPKVKLGLLSNSTALTIDAVDEAVKSIDRPFLKLDAGTEEVFKAINRPAEGVRFDKIVERLITLNNISIQTVMIDGNPSNVTDDELSAYFDLIQKIEPREVHLYSIDRPVPGRDIRLVPPEILKQI